MNYALIRNNIVENLVVWDGVELYNPGADYILVKVENGAVVGIGWVYDGTTFAPPPEL